MRDFSGIPFASLPDPKEPDFPARLRNALSTVDAWARDVSAAMRRIQNGEQPSGSGSPLGASDINPKGYGAVEAVVGDYLSKSDPADQSVFSQVQFLSGLSVSGGVLQTDNISAYFNNTDVTVQGNIVHTGTYYQTDGTLELGSGTSPSTINLTGDIVQTGTYYLTGDINMYSGACNLPALNVGGVVSIGSNGFNDAMYICDTNTGNVSQISFGGIGNNQTYSLPSAGGEIATTGATQTLINKTLRINSSLNLFQDSTVTTKNLRFDISGYASSTTRTIKWPDISGSPVLVGNTTAASGTLGISDLTAQTGSVGATTLMTGTTATAGMYRVSCYLKCTTAGTAGTVKVTVSFDDGTAQTKDIPLVTTAGVGATLSLTTLNGFEEGHVVVYSQASKNITYTTTVTGATGSPQYTVRVRIEKL